MKKLFSIILALIFSVSVSFASTEHPDFAPGSQVELVQKHINMRDTYIALSKTSNKHVQDYIALASVEQYLINRVINKVKDKLNYHANAVNSVKERIAYYEGLRADHSEEIRQLNSTLVYHKEQIIICSTELKNINGLKIEMKY